MKAAQTVAAQVATEALKQQLIQRAQAFATEIMLNAARDAAGDAASALLKARMAAAMQQAMINRGRLSGVSRVAATVFDRADAWARQRMQQLDANPLAGMQLHQRLAEAGLASNAFVFDPERMEALQTAFAAQGLEGALLAVLKGVRPDQLEGLLGAMPLASAAGDTFAYDAGAGSAEAASMGIVASLLELPLASAAPAGGAGAR